MPVENLGGGNPYWWPKSAAGGVVEKFLRKTYTGDGTNLREIDLGDDYDLVEVRIKDGNRGAGLGHLVLAWASGTSYGVMRHDGGATKMLSSLGASAAASFKGKMTGADANKIQLGSSGSWDQGTNQSGTDYEVLGWKFSSIET